MVCAVIGVSEAAVCRWRAEDGVDRGGCSGLSGVERIGLAQARRCIRELELELEITKKAAALFAAGGIRPKREVPGGCVPGRAGFEIECCCRVLGVAASG